MTTKKHPTPNKKDCVEIVDFSIRLGQACWDTYCRSEVGFVRVFTLPSGNARCRANDLFQLGFSARMLMCPPTDDSDETVDGDRMWKDYLGRMNGRVILSGLAHPDTPEFILNYAKGFFLEGFRAGTIAVREIFKL